MQVPLSTSLRLASRTLLPRYAKKTCLEEYICRDATDIDDGLKYSPFAEAVSSPSRQMRSKLHSQKMTCLVSSDVHLRRLALQGSRDCAGSLGGAEVRRAKHDTRIPGLHVKNPAEYCAAFDRCLTRCATRHSRLCSKARFEVATPGP